MSRCPNCRGNNVKPLRPKRPLKLRPDGTAIQIWLCKECEQEWDE